MYDNSFEKVPGGVENGRERVVPEGQDFAESFKSGVPEFAGDTFGESNKEEFFKDDESDTSAEDGVEYDDGLADAAGLINYGLDAASRELGVEQTVQLIKNFDSTGSENPIRDLFRHLGINTIEERRDVVDEAEAVKSREVGFREEFNMPKTTRRSKEGAFKAIGAMKELIAEVEGADPRYDALRAGAESAGKGYFEYAVKDFGTRGLTELFGVLAQQKKEAMADEKPEYDVGEDELIAEK